LFIPPRHPAVHHSYVGTGGVGIDVAIGLENLYVGTGAVGTDAVIDVGVDVGVDVAAAVAAAVVAAVAAAVATAVAADFVIGGAVTAAINPPSLFAETNIIYYSYKYYFINTRNVIIFIL